MFYFYRQFQDAACDISAWLCAINPIFFIAACSIVIILLTCTQVLQTISFSRFLWEGNFSGYISRFISPKGSSFIWFIEMFALPLFHGMYFRYVHNFYDLILMNLHVQIGFFKVSWTQRVGLGEITLYGFFSHFLSFFIFSLNIFHKIIASVRIAL